MERKQSFLEDLGVTSLVNNEFKGKTVLVTGHTGFKGSWLAVWLNELGANVIGYSLEPNTASDNFVASDLAHRIKSVIGDIRDYAELKKLFDKCQPEFVFHLAAQSLVKVSYEQPKLTYDTNVGGTVNVFECCRLTDSVRVVVNVTSDKCYENREWLWGYRETDRLGGYDPYSSTKACSEIITAAYRNSFFNLSEYRKHHKALSSVRAGNVIGGGDWQKDRLVPDCVRALRDSLPICIRSPRSIRPWQYVLEPLSGYLLLASKMSEDGETYSGAWNFGPDNKSVITVEDLVKRLIQYWGSGQYKDLSKTRSPEYHESKSLMLDISKAMAMLDWRPVLDVDEAIRHTVEWYKADIVDYDFCVSQIREYTDKLTKRSPAFGPEGGVGEGQTGEN